MSLQVPAQRGAKLRLQVRAMIHISAYLWAAKLYTHHVDCLRGRLPCVPSFPFPSLTMDVEQALSTFDESPIPHKDFGFLVVPKHLRCSATHPYHFGPWSKFVFGAGCALSQRSSSTRRDRF